MYKQKRFYSIFFKKSWGRGATPPALSAESETLLRPKAQESSRKRPGDGFGVGNPRRGFPDGRLPHPICGGEPPQDTSRTSCNKIESLCRAAEAQFFIKTPFAIYKRRFSVPIDKTAFLLYAIGKASIGRSNRAFPAQENGGHRLKASPAARRRNASGSGRGNGFPQYLCPCAPR